MNWTDFTLGELVDKCFPSEARTHVREMFDTLYEKKSLLTRESDMPDLMGVVFAALVQTYRKEKFTNMLEAVSLLDKMYTLTRKMGG